MAYRGFHPKDSGGIEGTINHELGHVIDSMLGIRYDKKIKYMYKQNLNNMPSFTRKDYTRGAIKAGYKLKAIDDILDSFLELFREYDPNFNEDTFDYRYIPLLRI